MAGVRALRLVRRHLATVDSTNTWARAHAPSLDRDAITMITADMQTAGRGRHGRTWVSTGEDITATFAFLLPAEAMPSAYQLSPLLAVAARRALARHAVAAQIKWPNDIVLGGSHKAGGILCEVEACGGECWAILGIGINVNSTPEAIGLDRPIWPLTTLRHHAGRSFDVPALADDLGSTVSEVVPRWLAGASRSEVAGMGGSVAGPTTAGWDAFHAEYLSGSVLVGRRIAFHEGGKGGRVEGVVETIGRDGRLVLVTGEGERREYLSGEVVGLQLVDGGGAAAVAMMEGHHDGKV